MDLCHVLVPMKWYAKVLKYVSCGMSGMQHVIVSFSIGGL